MICHLYSNSYLCDFIKVFSATVIGDTVECDANGRLMIFTTHAVVAGLVQYLDQQIVSFRDRVITAPCFNDICFGSGCANRLSIIANGHLQVPARDNFQLPGWFIAHGAEIHPTSLCVGPGFPLRVAFAVLVTNTSKKGDRFIFHLFLLLDLFS